MARIASRGILVEYLILLALAESKMHGADIQKQIVGDTVGEYLHDTRIYRELKQLEVRHMVISHQSPPSKVRVYSITPRGRLRLLNQTKWLGNIVNKGKLRTGLIYGQVVSG
jgi:DNA-binding PadR family transcriptional regulator